MRTHTKLLYKLAAWSVGFVELGTTTRPSEQRSPPITYNPIDYLHFSRDFKCKLPNNKICAILNIKKLPKMFDRAICK
jgi:hypothetical protein